jgi:hypothetical protein
MAVISHDMSAGNALTFAQHAGVCIGVSDVEGGQEALSHGQYLPGVVHWAREIMIYEQ